MRYRQLKNNVKKLRNKLFQRKWLFYSFGLSALYTAFVLSFVWWHCYQSPLTGGSNGQLDAYRHTLASAVVAYTTSPKLVEITTIYMESNNTPANLMDQHNNAIGANIGITAHSFSSLTMLVDAKIRQGKVNATDQNQTTWLPKTRWRTSVIW
ncbi:MAG: hypothetical protein WBP13_12595 [Methylophilaceae bacterium]